MIELPIKEQITNLLQNEVLTALIRDKIYKPNEHVEVELEGSLSFNISMSGDNLVIQMEDLKPKITFYPFAGRLLKKVGRMNGRLNTVTISSDKMVLGIDGLPDQTITLT